MQGVRRGRRAAAVVLSVMLVTLVGATAALAGKPDISPWNPGPLVLLPGQACAFDVTIESLPGSNVTEKVFPNGTAMYTGTSVDRVSGNGKSVTFHNAGQTRYTPLASGDLRIQVSGRSLIYLYEGDQGPFGTVGEEGALYRFVGNVDEILSAQNVITSFRWSGTFTEVCGLLD